MMTKEQAWDLIKNGPGEMDEVIEAIQSDAERAGYERGVRDVLEILSQQDAILIPQQYFRERLKKAILSLLTKTKDEK